MAIKLAAAPREAPKLLQRGVEQLLSAGMVDAQLGEIDAIGAPHRVFHLGIDKLVAGTPVAQAAQHTGWSAPMVDRKKQSRAAAELAITRAGLKFASVTRGPHAAGFSAAEAAAERWSRQARGDHELALLRIPGAFCIALWLRGAGGKDGFVPIAPCPPGLKPGTVYGEDEFRAALLPEARKQLEGPGEGRPPR